LIRRSIKAPDKVLTVYGVNDNLLNCSKLRSFPGTCQYDVKFQIIEHDMKYNISD